MDIGFELLVEKKSGNLENWDSGKIVKAVTKAAQRIATTITDEEYAKILSLVETSALQRNSNVIKVEVLHALVENALREVRPDVYESYASYRNWIKKEAEMNAAIWNECQSIQFLGEKSANGKENANSDAKMVSTKRVMKLNVLTTHQYERYFLNAVELKASEEGYIYINDKSARLDTMNCCLFDVKNVLKNGFEMGNMWYNEPKTLDTAFDVIGDIVLMAASQQYGGFTLPEIDDVLEKYCALSYEQYLNKYITVCKMDKSEAEEIAYADVVRDLEQGFQGWEYKFNSVASSRGDYPFITATFGLNGSRWGRAINMAILTVRKKGQGKKGHKKPVLFPKLVFLYDKNKHGKGQEQEDIFEAAIDCTRKCMYPDYLSLTGKGYVAEIYKKYGVVISPMGCRAFLSPWFERGGAQPADENDKPVFIGRFNIGVVSLHLPMILAKSRRMGVDFYTVLDFYLELIRGIHKRTYDYLGQMKAGMNTLGFCEGGFYGGNLDFNDNIEPVLKSATASFGITALNELQMLYNGKSLVQDGAFALEVMQYIKHKVDEYKKEDGHLYAIYGTPAENLCGKQVVQFRKEFGIIKGVSDREYVSNSFHCHVTEDISPIQKQDLEGRFWNYFDGGKIQYVRYPSAENIQAFLTLIRRAMEEGFYEGANLSLAYCDECGLEKLEMDECPKCHSRNITKIDRMNGYLAYSRVHGDTRLNAAKMAEIAERKSM